MPVLACILIAILAFLPGLRPPDAVREEGSSSEAQQEQEVPDETPAERAARLFDRPSQSLVREELLGPDGKPILPGQIPKGTADGAREAWNTLLGGFSRKPISAFQLGFYLRQRQPDNPQTNDVNLDFSYLEPGYVRAELESGRTHLRGPQGDYLIDGEEVIRLRGREGAEDKKQIDDMASIARNFVALTAPRSLRLASLELLAEPPPELPTGFTARAKELSWLAIKSPDFFVQPGVKTKDTPRLPIYLARLGFDPETKEILFATIHEDRRGALVLETAVLVQLEQHADRNGFLVPHRVGVHGVDIGVQPWRFRAIPTSRLDLRRKFGRLNARLSPADFLP